MNLIAFHSWLMTACPATADLLLRELQHGHRINPAGYSGLPRNAGDLTGALKMLAVKGLVEERQGMWRWLPERAKPEPQKALF